MYFCSISDRAFSTLSLYLSLIGLFFLSFSFITVLIKSSTPFCLDATVLTTGHPSSLEKASTSILSPLLSTTSIMFKAITTGIFSSISWLVKYKFLTRFDASTKLIIKSGFSPTKYCLLTTSSKVYGESE